MHRTYNECDVARALLVTLAAVIFILVGCGRKDTTEPTASNSAQSPSENGGRFEIGTPAPHTPESDPAPGKERTIRQSFEFLGKQLMDRDTNSALREAEALRPRCESALKANVTEETIEYMKGLAEMFSHLDRDKEAGDVLRAALYASDKLNGITTDQFYVDMEVNALKEKRDAIRMSLAPGDPTLDAYAQYREAMTNGSMRFKNVTEAMNEIIKRDQTFRETNPDAAEVMNRIEGPHSFADGFTTTSDPKKWFHTQWSKWNAMFERMPESIAVDVRGGGSGFEIIPTNILSDESVMAEVAVNLKGLILDRELDFRRKIFQSDDPAVNQRALEMKKLEQEQEVFLATPRKEFTEAEKQKIAALVKRTLELRETLVREVNAERTERTAVSDLQDALMDEETVLVEFLRFGRFRSDKNQIEQIYGAAVILKKGPAKFFPLAEATLIEEKVRSYHAALRKNSIEKPTEFDQILSSLYKLTWEPWEKALPKKTKRVMVCPDALLNFVNFGTLLKGDQFLAENYDIRLLSSARDLLLHPYVAGDLSLVTFADPNFNEAQTQPTEKRWGIWPLGGKSTQRGFLAPFDPLPNTKTHSRIWKDAFEKSVNGGRTIGFTNSSASEAELRNVKQPLILLLATHGFCWSKPGDDESIATQPMMAFFKTANVARDWPMRSSGLALAGASKTTEAWANGKAPQPENDGLFLAAEVGSLDVEGTWLVVLSACDTGLGRTVGGEGVLGLRRAFVKAGAQNVLQTLWEVRDDYAPTFHERFVTELFKSQNPSEALSKTQTAELKRIRLEKKSTWAAVRSAGPFVMTSLGNGKQEPVW